MKRLILTAWLLLTGSVLAAQNCIVVDSEKIFKSIEAYNAALTQLDELAKQYQTQVDAKYKAIEQVYEAYMARKASLSASAQRSYEDNILKQEQEAQEFQENLFGSEGSLMAKRKELIQPIQKRVFEAIDNYAKRLGADLVLDKANNPTLLYNSTKLDHTQQVIQLLK